MLSMRVFDPAAHAEESNKAVASIMMSHPAFCPTACLAKAGPVVAHGQAK